MKLKTKRKIKHYIGIILGVLLIVLALLIAYFKDRLIETSLSIITFYIYRYLFEKQFHANSMFNCFVITSIVLVFLINIEVRITTSVLFSITITFVLTLISYYVRDYLDNKVLVSVYKGKYEKFNHKAIDNLSEEEMIYLMPNIKFEVIHITYNYLHKPKNITAIGFAYKNGISEATLYRYVKQVKDNYESLRVTS